MSPDQWLTVWILLELLGKGILVLGVGAICLLPIVKRWF